MNQNKVIDAIYKKLLKADYSHEIIRNFLSLRFKFSNFENFLYYMLLMSQKNIDDDLFNITKYLQDYLNTIIERYHIKPLTINDIKVGDELTNWELFILGAKGYNSKNNFYFDVDDNLYICLDNVEHKKFKNLIKIKLNNYFDGIFNSKINQKILQVKFDKILLFKRNETKNQFMGFYNFYCFDHYYSNSQQVFGIVLYQGEIEMDLMISYQNWKHQFYLESLNDLKTELKQLATNFVNYSHLSDNIDLINNHHILIMNFLTSAIIDNNHKVIELMKEKYRDTLINPLTIFSLATDVSIINEYYLVIFSGTFDILYGRQIVEDHLNNVFICFNNSSMKYNDDDTIDVRFVKSFNNQYFNLDINRKIFNTSEESSVIFMFDKHASNNYLFKGYYRVSKVFIDEDNNAEPTPIFKLRRLNPQEMMKSFTYIWNNSPSNNYKNAFISFNNEQFAYPQWFNKKQLLVRSQPTKLDVRVERLNSYIYKYNWILNKCKEHNNSDQFARYLKVFKDFDFKIINIIFKCYGQDFEYLINNRIMEPWTIAYEMTKCNWIGKELFDNSYQDYYPNKKAKYEICLKTLKRAID